MLDQARATATPGTRVPSGCHPSAPVSPLRAAVVRSYLSEIDEASACRPDGPGGLIHDDAQVPKAALAVRAGQLRAAQRTPRCGVAGAFRPLVPGLLDLCSSALCGLVATECR